MRKPFLLLFAGVFAPIWLGAQDADSAVTAPWWARVEAGGDIRVRAETFQQDGSPDRFRGRVRLRLSAATEVNKDVSVGVRVVTGNPFDPITANQTFTGWYTRKPITVDRAFVTYHPTAAPALNFGAGKFEFPIRITNMVFDDNLNWEGGYEQISTNSERPATLKFTAVQSPMNESSGGRDSFLFVESAQATLTAGRNVFALALSSLRFTNADPLAVAIGKEELDARTSNSVRRNSSGEVTGYGTGFNLIDLVADAKFLTARKEYPVSVTFDFVKNLDADSRNTGVWIETQYGLAESPRTASIGYIFSRVQQDAVLAPFLYDDMLGSNATMHEVSFSYVPIPRINLDFNVILSKWLEPLPADNPALLTRFQLSARAHF